MRAVFTQQSGLTLARMQALKVRTARFEPVVFVAGRGFPREMGRLRPMPVVKGIGAPVPSVTQRVVKSGAKHSFRSRGSSGKISRSLTSKAGAPPVFSTTMAKVMQSLASTLATSLLMGWTARPAEVIGVLKRGQLPGGRKTTGPVTAGVKTALGLVASMMPLVTRSDGSRTCTWPRAIWQNVAPKVLV